MSYKAVEKSTATKKEEIKMLNWIKEKNGHWSGFCDGDFLYRVFETPEGWMWEDSQSYEGECDFDTEREAMNAAAEHFSKRLAMEERMLLAELEVALTAGEIEDILAEELFEEAKVEGWLK